MTPSPKFSASVLCAALAIATPAMASHVVEIYTTPAGVTEYYYVPHYAPDYYYVEPVTTYYYEPRVTYAPRIDITAPRLSEDHAITDDVVDVLANDLRLSGKIGVETQRNSVTLTGRVSTPGQARIAASDAQSVDGVREVRNELRTRVGGSP